MRETTMKVSQFFSHLAAAIKEEGGDVAGFSVKMVHDVANEADVAEDKIEAVAKSFLAKLGVKTKPDK